MKQTSEIVESVVQYASVWKLLVNELPNADLADRPGLSISWADNPFPFWNAVFLTEQLADPDLLESRLKEAATYVRKKRHSGLIYVCEDYLSGTAKETLRAILEQERLEAAIPITGMAGNILPPAGVIASTPTHRESDRRGNVARVCKYQLRSIRISLGMGPHRPAWIESLERGLYLPRLRERQSRLYRFSHRQ